MIDDDDVALGSAAAHFGDETAFVLFALLAGTGIGTGVELVPERVASGNSA